MAGSLNKVMLIGNVGADVEMKYFEDGNCIGNFPIATNNEYKNKSTGEMVKKTEWHRIVVRNKGAEICEKYLSKGDKIYVEGRIETRKWKDQEGNDRYSTEIQCREFTFLTPKGQSGMNPENSQLQGQSHASPSENQAGPDLAKENSASEEDEADDLPF